MNLILDPKNKVCKKQLSLASLYHSDWPNRKVIFRRLLQQIIIKNKNRTVLKCTSQWMCNITSHRTRLAYHYRLSEMMGKLLERACYTLVKNYLKNNNFLWGQWILWRIILLLFHSSDYIAVHSDQLP